ncbi:hypothetical protein [Spongorhabdus nitratireducens]
MNKKAPSEASSTDESLFFGSREEDDQSHLPYDFLEHLFTVLSRNTELPVAFIENRLIPAALFILTVPMDPTVQLDEVLQMEDAIFEAEPVPAVTLKLIYAGKDINLSIEALGRYRGDFHLLVRFTLQNNSKAFLLVFDDLPLPSGSSDTH